MAAAFKTWMYRIQHDLGHATLAVARCKTGNHIAIGHDPGGLVFFLLPKSALGPLYIAFKDQIGGINGLAA